MTDPQPSPDVAIPGQPAEDLPKRFPLVTYGVIAISVALFALDDDSWIADAWHIYDGSFWSLITSAFFHVNLMHLAFNLYWLWVLGRCLERVVGSGRFLLLFAAAAWVSSAAQLAVSGQTGIGLSGVGYALFGAMWIAGKWVPAFRRVVDSPVIGLFLFWLCLCVGLSVVGDSQIGNTAHFAGLAFGMVLGASAQVPLRSRSVTAALLLVAASTATLLWAPWSSRWQGLQGQRAQDAGDLDRAMEAFTRFIELDPDHPWGYGERGWVHIEKGDFARAFADFNTVIQLDPLDTMAHSGRGCARRMSNDLEGAIADLDRAIQLDPAFAWNYGERARTRIAQADYGEAIADFSEAIKLDPESAAPYRGRGQARRYSDDYEGAIDDLDKAIELEPDEGWPYFERGWAHQNLSNYPASMADFTKAIELDPESASAYSGRAWTKAYIDDLDGAIADLQQASVLAPDDISVHEEFSVYLRIRGEDRAFVKVMTRAVELGCDSAQGLGWLAWIQATSTDPEARNNTSALALAKRVVSRVPDSGEFQTTLGVALYRNGEWAEAREALQRSIDLGHKSRTSLLFIAMALKQMGQVDEARRRYDQAIALPTYLPPDEEEYQRFRAEAEALLD